MDFNAFLTAMDLTKSNEDSEILKGMKYANAKLFEEGLSWSDVLNKKIIEKGKHKIDINIVEEFFNIDEDVLKDLSTKSDYFAASYKFFMEKKKALVLDLSPKQKQWLFKIQEKLENA